MTAALSQLRLMAWLSPAFPTGAFSYSHGLEAATLTGHLETSDDLKAWLSDLLQSGPGWNDAVLLAAAWRKADEAKSLTGIADLATAMSISSTRHLETTAQGSAFLEAAQAWGDMPDLPPDCTLPVAVGACAAHLSLPLEETLTAFLHAYISNQIQAALRLMKLGQQGGVEILASLEDQIIETAHRAAASSLEYLGSNTFMADKASMQHETLTSRIFRS